MKLKLTLLYVLSFLALTFFIHELHDWAHTLAARIMNGCWGPRAFDNWQFCDDLTVSSGQRMLAIVAGPLVNFALLWVGWQKMDERNTLGDQSFGCSLVLATLPFNNLLAAARGGGDLTNALRLLLRHTNHHLVSVIGLLIILIISVPPLVRAFVVLPWWLGRLVFYPVFLFVPGFLDHFVGTTLNKWLIVNAPGDKAYWWIIGWTVFNMTVWLLTKRKMNALISDEELPL